MNTSLKTLSIGGLDLETQMSPSTMSPSTGFENLKAIETLRLRYPSNTYKNWIGNLSTLKNIELNTSFLENEIDFEFLYDLKNLETLKLKHVIIHDESHTNRRPITEADITELKANLPNCKITIVN